MLCAGFFEEQEFYVLGAGCPQSNAQLQDDLNMAVLNRDENTWCSTLIQVFHHIHRTICISSHNDRFPESGASRVVP